MFALATVKEPHALGLNDDVDPPETASDLADEALEIDRNGLHTKGVGFDLCQVEDVVDEGVEGLA